MEKEQRDNLLYTLSNILKDNLDLRGFYYKSLSILLMAFGFEKVVFFKYSPRKLCFDSKVGLEKSQISHIQNHFLNGGSLLELISKLDIEQLYNTDFNLKIRQFNLPCNDISRALIKKFITKQIRHIQSKQVNNKRIQDILSYMQIEESLYIPLVSMDTVVGFILATPAIQDYGEIVPFSTLMALTLDNLINIKIKHNLEKFIEDNKNRISHERKLYEIGKTASTITHEIKNSLIGIIGLFEKLKKHINITEQTKRYIDIIDNQLNKLYNFTLDINKYSKSSFSSNKEFLNLVDLIDKVIEITATFNSNFVFSVCIDNHASKIYADREQLEQVLINIIKNSIEAYKHKKGGKIRIMARREDGFITIRIKDNSGGVKESDLNEMVKPFFTTKSNGTGLGLSIVNEIIKEHNGVIEFRNIDNGLECILKFPIPKKNFSEVCNGKKDNDS